MAIQRKPLTQVNFVCLDLPYDSGSAPLPFSLLTSFALADSYPGPFNYRVPIGGSWKLKAGLVSYLLLQLDMPLTLERLEMTLNEAASLQTLARACLTDGLTYEKVRNWWLTQGKVLHSRAFALKHEKEFLATRCLRVLCFFENKRPLWLNYGADGTATLHEDRDSAFEFPVNSSTELLPQSCERLADEFKVMCKLIGATSVKVLPGAKADTPQDIESPEAEATP